jgi:protein-tyrosine-phosphatase
MACVVIHYVCLGNAFRSFIAETYTRSLAIEDVTAISSGVYASITKEQNAIYHKYVQQEIYKRGISQFAKDHYADDLNNELLSAGDVTVCMNERVYNEASKRFELPADTLIWDVTNVNEKERIISTEADVPRYIAMAYDEIVRDVDALIATLHN